MGPLNTILTKNPPLIRTQGAVLPQHSAWRLCWPIDEIGYVYLDEINATRNWHKPSQTLSYKGLIIQDFSVMIICSKTNAWIPNLGSAYGLTTTLQTLLFYRLSLYADTTFLLSGAAYCISVGTYISTAI